jgi:hypothetical protein
MGEYICDQIATGRTLQSICEDRDGLPKPMTVARWADAFPAFNRDYTRARELQLEAWKQEARDLANSPQMGDEFVAVEEELINGSADGAGGYVKRQTRRERRDMLGHRRLGAEVLIRLIGAVQQAETSRIARVKLETERPDPNTPRKIIVETNMPPDPPEDPGDAA